MIPSKIFVTVRNMNKIIFKLEIVSNLVSVSLSPKAENIIERVIVRIVIFLILASVEEKGFLRTKYRSRIMVVLKKRDI